MRDHITDYLLLLLLALIWSTSFLLIKVAVASAGPVTITAMRMAIATAILLCYLAIRRSGIPLHPRALLLYVVVGVLGNTLPFTLINFGETRIDSSLAAIMMGIMPISTFVLAHYFVPDEPFSRRRVFGVGLGFFGLLVLVGLTALAGLGDDVLGQVAVLGGAISYGITTVFVRTQPGFPGHQMAAGAVLVGFLAALPLAFLLEDPLSMTITRESLYAIIALGVGPTALASLMYFRIIRNLGATTFSQLNYVVPVLGSLWGVVFLGELLHFRMLLALGLVLAGIYFIQSGNAGSRG